MSKKLLPILLSVLLLFSSFGMAFGAGFADMPDNWSTAALNNAVDNGLLNGYGTGDGKLLKPGDPLTRAQMAAVVNRAFASEKAADISKVTDVKPSAWFAQDMAKAVKMGTFSFDNKMRPNDKITRQEAFTVLARAFKLVGTDASHKALDVFSDKDQIAEWALNCLNGMAAAGYIQGSGGKLNPKANITRAEFAVVMDNLVKDYIDTKGDVTEVAAKGNVVIRTPGVVLKDVTVKGDLIIADGVGEGDVTLDNVTVEGRTVVRGGGENSVIVKGGSQLGTVIVAKVDGVVRVFVEGGAEVDVIYVDDGSDDVIVEGKVNTLEVAGEGVTVYANDADIDSATVSGDNSKVVVGEGSKVKDGKITGASSAIVVDEGGSVDSVDVTGANATIGGDGDVGEVKVADGVEGTEVGGKPVEGGQTVDGSGDAVVTGPTAPARPTDYIVTPKTGQTLKVGDAIKVTAKDAKDLRIILWAGELDSVATAKGAYYDDNRVFSSRIEDLKNDGMAIDGEDGEFTITIDDNLIGFLETGKNDKNKDFAWKSGDKTTWIITPVGEDNDLLEVFNTWDGRRVGETFFVYTLGEAKPVVNETQHKGYDTIQAAIDEAEENNTILVGPGTYEEALKIGVKGLTIKSVEGYEKTVINANDADYAVQVTKSDLGTVIFEGFTVKAWKKGGINQPMGSGGANSAFHVLNNKIEAPEISPQHGNSIQVSGNDSHVKGNMVGTSTHEGDEYHASGILVVNAENVIVEENNITGVDAAISVQGGKWGSPTRDAKSITIKNNIINNIAIGISVEFKSLGITIENNDISDVTWAVQKVSEEGKVPQLDLETVLSKNTFPEGFYVIGDAIRQPVGGKASNTRTGVAHDTIEDAIKNAKAEDTILLGVGKHDLSEFRWPNGDFKANITIVGGEGVSLVSPRFDRQYYGLIGDGLAFRNINFIDKYFIVNSLDVKGLVIDNCTFTKGAYLQIGPVGNRDEITIKNSTFEGVEGKTSILIQGVSKNICLENNTIIKAGYNGIQINKLKGELKIDGNTINGAVNAAIRVATLEGAVLTVTNNTMTATNTDGYPGEVIRITGNVITGTLTGNTSDSEDITFVNGIGKVSTNEQR